MNATAVLLFMLIAVLRRADDNPETFKLRLQAYHAQTAPLVDYYRSKNLLRSVDGMMPMDEVAAAIRRVIGA